MLEEFDRTEWVEESKNVFNVVGKNIGLKDLINIDYSNSNGYKMNRLFINPIKRETTNQLTLRIYNFIEKWYLSNGKLPKYLVLSQKDYNRLLEETSIIDEKYILGIKIDIFKEKNVSYKENKKWSYN